MKAPNSAKSRSFHTRDKGLDLDDGEGLENGVDGLVEDQLDLEEGLDWPANDEGGIILRVGSRSIR